MSNELTRLLPCPFCGGAAHVVKNSFPPNTPWRHPSCGTEGCPGEVHEQDEQGGTNCDCRTDAQAIALWNRRALSDHAEAGQPESEREPIATVIDNNQVWWTNIIETAPGVTLLVGTKLYAHPPAPRATEQAWIPVGERLPEYSVVVLATDGEYLAAASRSFEIEGDMRLRGYGADGKIGPRFTDQIPNQDAGKRHEYFFPIGCSAFNVNTDVEDYDGPLHFTPSHWMPLPPSPKGKE